MRRALVTFVAAAALLLVACGDDSGGGDDGAVTTTAEGTVAGDPVAGEDGEPAADDDVCGQVEALAGIDPEAAPTAADVEQVRAVAANTSGDVAAAMTLVADVGDFLAGLTPEELADPDELAGLADITTEAELAAAGRTLVSFAADECGLEVPLFADFAG